MGRRMRKNLMVDGEKVAELARRRGTSESEAVRQAVDYALAAEEVIEAMRELSKRDGIEDVFGLLPDEAAEAAGAVETNKR
ncbi:MAG: ribbon-helix-helix protein, CopG family [Chloroflexi bacterium]|nr:ribbon-helix-helix protein, CopG family [Chloroflexota bacterium]